MYSLVRGCCATLCVPTGACKKPAAWTCCAFSVPCLCWPVMLLLAPANTACMNPTSTSTKVLQHLWHCHQQSLLVLLIFLLHSFPPSAACSPDG